MKILIIGAGGHGQVVADILLAQQKKINNNIQPIGFLDDNQDLQQCSFFELPVLGSIARYSEIEHDGVILAIGNNSTRSKFFHQLGAAGENFVSAIHPSATVGLDVNIGKGTVICAGVIVNSGSQIGHNVILNTGCTVDHHNLINDHCHIGPGAHLGGDVTLGQETLVGVGATVMPQRRIGVRSVVGAGAVVTQDVPDQITVVGIPARSINNGTKPDNVFSKDQRNMSKNISMSSPDLTAAEINAVSQVIQTPYLSFGPYIDQFEKQFADYIGAKHAVAVSSGTAGLHLSMIAAGVKEQDMVITTPFSFIASANCILYERATPIFVDVDPRTGNIDPHLVLECINDISHGPQTAKRWLPPALRQNIDELFSSNGSRNNKKAILKAILPIHAFGQPADMTLIQKTARQHRLSIVEDACEAIGAEYKGTKVGLLGDVATFAFYPNKQMTTGEGGMIVTNNAEWAGLFRSLRNQGRDVFNAWLQHTRLGYNYRMDEMSAALGLKQIQRIDDILAKRTRVANWYNQRLAELEEFIERPGVVTTTSYMSWFVYVIRIRPPINRNHVMEKLSEASIPSRPYFTPIHLQPFYRDKFGYQLGDFPITEYLGDISLALPFSGVMTETQVDHVCMVLRKILFS